METQVIIGGGTSQEPNVWLGNTIDGTGRKLYLNVNKPHNIAIIAPSGSGKTMLLSVLCEGLTFRKKTLVRNFDTGIPVLVLDLLGNMHGLKKINLQTPLLQDIEEQYLDDFNDNIVLNYIPSYISDDGYDTLEDLGFNRLAVDFSKITEAEIYELLNISPSRDTNLAALVKLVMKTKPESPSDFYAELMKLRDDLTLPNNLAAALESVIFKAEDLIKYSIFEWHSSNDVISHLIARKTAIVNCEKSLMEAKEVTNMWINLCLSRLKTERRKANESESQKRYFGTGADFKNSLPSFWLAIDEVHRLNHKTQETYNDFVRTARNWNCSTIVSTQCVDDINKDTRKNLTAVFLGRMSEREAIKALKDFPIPINHRRVLNCVQDLLPGQFLVLDKIGGKNFYLNTRERLTQHVGATVSTTELIEMYKEKKEVTFSALQVV